jgi:hypothetical protein
MSVLPPGEGPQHYGFSSPSEAMQELQKAVDKVLEEQKERAAAALGKPGAQHEIDALFHEKEEKIRSLAEKAGLHPPEVKAYVEQVRQQWRQEHHIEEKPSSAPSPFDMMRETSKSQLDSASPELIALAEAFKNAKTPLAKDAIFQQIQKALSQTPEGEAAKKSASGNIQSNDYFDLGAWQSWNFMKGGKIDQTGLNTYLDSYASQMQSRGLKQVTLSFAQVCDLAKMISGDFSHCDPHDALWMLAVNTQNQLVDGKSVISYIADRFHADGLNVMLSFGGASAGANDWNFGFSSTNTPEQAAQQLAAWAKSSGFSGIDFDVESGSIATANRPADVASFFYNLHQDAGMPITLTVMGNATDWGPSGKLLGPIFSQGHNFSQMFDGLNLMLYNGKYYLNAGQKPPQSWDLNLWISQLKANTGLSASECASMMHIGFDGAIDYSKASSSGGPLPYDPSKVPPTVKTSGQYAAYILQQIQKDLGVTLGSSFFWDDNANYTVNTSNYESQFFSNNPFEQEFYNSSEIDF